MEPLRFTPGVPPNKPLPTTRLIGLSKTVEKLRTGLIAVLE
jgi:hypothetical protein